MPKNPVKPIKALVTDKGNLLVNFHGMFFYMTPDGQHLKSDYEIRNKGQRLKSQEWDWALRTWRKKTIILDNEQRILAGKVSSKLS